MAATRTRERLTDAAFELCESASFESITVDQIASRAGLSRMTFFRYFKTKEDVVFPDHARLLAELDADLSVSVGSRLAAVCQAGRKVLASYVAEGERARARYALTRSIPSLRAREIATVHRYQNLFRQHLTATPDDEAYAGLEVVGGEIMASSVVAATNYIIRKWLRSEIADPMREFDRVAAVLMTMDWSPWQQSRPAEAPRASFVVVQSGDDATALMAHLRAAFPGSA